MKKLSLLVSLAGFLAFILSPTVFALTQQDVNDILSQHPYYNATDTSCINASSGSTNLAGSDNAAKIWNYFISKGLTPPQAAGIMGNLQAESHMEPRLVQYGGKNSRGEISKQGQPSSLDDTMVIDGTTGYGLAQWTDKGRQTRLHDAVVAAGKQDSDLGVQLDYLWGELGGLLDQIKALDDVTAVSTLILQKFEKPADQGTAVQNTRANLGKAILVQFGSTAPVSSGSVVASPCTGSRGGSGQIVGGYSLPVDKSFYDEHPVWFTKPHHDYPSADIPVPAGTQVYSVTAGKVIGINPGGSCGNGVIVDAGNGVRFTYCHGSDGSTVPGAQNGDTVTAGQLIMHSNFTGSVQPPGPAGAHLHFQININGGLRCPQNLLVGIAEGNVPDINQLPASGCTY